MHKYILKRVVISLVLLLAAVGVVYAILSLAPRDPSTVLLEKPVIYLYPETPQEVVVRLDTPGRLTRTEPLYRDGWRVTAHPDGTILDETGQSFEYLFWEAESDLKWDLTEGFCIAGSDTAAFLENSLARLGLSAHEREQFTYYWLPRMENDRYNIIAFQGSAYEQANRLTVTPAPDTVIRVFMTWAASDRPLDLPPQTLSAPERAGFTVVEWGGCEVALQ